MAMPKQPLPAFLNGKVSLATYARWIQGRAKAHVKRDRKRGYLSADVASYKQAIHAAVEKSNGRDAYTCEALAWSLLGEYCTDASQRERRAYKWRFALQPTVGHPLPGRDRAEFSICAWRTNDAKNDLSLPDFIALCKLVVTHAAR